MTLIKCWKSWKLIFKSVSRTLKSLKRFFSVLEDQRKLWVHLKVHLYHCHFPCIYFVISASFQCTVTKSFNVILSVLTPLFFRDAICISMCCAMSSVFAGFVIFAIIGFMAHDSQIPIEDVVAGGIIIIVLVYQVFKYCTSNENLAILSSISKLSTLFHFLELIKVQPEVNYLRNSKLYCNFVSWAVLELLIKTCKNKILFWSVAQAPISYWNLNAIVNLSNPLLDDADVIFQNNYDIFKMAHKTCSSVRRSLLLRPSIWIVCM